MEWSVIDAFAYFNPTSGFRFGAPDFAKIYILSSYHQTSECAEVAINKIRRDSLAKEQRRLSTTTFRRPARPIRG